MMLRRVSLAFAFLVLFSALGAPFGHADVEIEQLSPPVLHGRLLENGFDVELTFDAVPGAYEYHIERALSPAFEQLL